jgi:hypothetical protein
MPTIRSIGPDFTEVEIEAILAPLSEGYDTGNSVNDPDNGCPMRDSIALGLLADEAERRVAILRGAASRLGRFAATMIEGEQARAQALREDARNAQEWLAVAGR